MFFWEKFMSFFAFACFWGLLVMADFTLRMLGMADFLTIQTGVIFPYAAPIMTGLVILAFFHFLTSKNDQLGKKFYASCNFLMLVVLTCVLLIDFTLRFVAFDQTYCRG